MNNLGGLILRKLLYIEKSGTTGSKDNRFDCGVVMFEIFLTSFIT